MGTVSLASQRVEGMWCTPFLLGVDDAVSMRLQSGEIMKNREKLRKADKSWIAQRLRPQSPTRLQPLECGRPVSWVLTAESAAAGRVVGEQLTDTALEQIQKIVVSVSQIACAAVQFDFDRRDHYALMRGEHEAHTLAKHGQVHCITRPHRVRWMSNRLNHVGKNELPARF
jgi:hypothetical protein